MSPYITIITLPLSTQSCHHCHTRTCPCLITVPFIKQSSWIVCHTSYHQHFHLHVNILSLFCCHVHVINTSACSQIYISIIQHSSYFHHTSRSSWVICPEYIFNILFLERSVLWHIIQYNPLSAQISASFYPSIMSLFQHSALDRHSLQHFLILCPCPSCCPRPSFCSYANQHYVHHM